VNGRGGWIAVVAGLAILAYITYNTFTTPGQSSSGLEAGARMPPFAAPLVTSDLVGDANVARHADQGQAGARPACSVTDPRALNSCTLARRGPVVLAFFTDSAGRCVDALDAMQRIATRHPDVGFAAVAIRGDRDDLRGVVAQHGWSFPVAQDRDGAVANLYGVAICPTVVLAREGGVVMRTALGSDETTQAVLERAVRRLEDPAAGAAQAGGGAG
jgi:peroxiredoxin